MSWLGFWIFLSTVYACDSFLFVRGYDTYFHGFKTDEEKALRKAVIKHAKDGT